MSRELSFYLGKSLTKFLKKPIRNQLDIIKLSLKTVQEIITPNSDTKEFQSGIGRDQEEGIRIVYPNHSKEKLQRIFFLNRYPDYQEEDMYTIQSFVFPFNLKKTESTEIIASYSSPGLSLNFDHATLSQIISLINIIDNQELTWGDTWVSELMDLLFGKETTLDSTMIFYIVNDLLTLDFGYLRFDNDPEHAEDNHPRYHIDTHFENRASYKLGFSDKIDISELIELLDNSSEVKYIKNSL